MVMPYDDLEEIQKMWKKILTSIWIIYMMSQLRSPRYTLNTLRCTTQLFFSRKKAEQTRKNVRHERYEYFTGKSDPEVYQENPFPKKIRDKDTLQKYLDSDDKLSQISLKVEYYDVILNYLESILKMIQNRTYQIKNAIDFLKFQAGYG